MDERTAQRFWIKVDKTGDCWLWTAARTHGYGIFRVGGRAGRNVHAHRFSYELCVGLIPPGMQVDHQCHNADPDCRIVSECLHRRCVNPAHLRLATNAENSRRGKCGEVNSARCRSQTHCKRGHPLSGDNVRWFGPAKQYRQCKTCEWIRRGRPNPPRRISEQDVALIRHLVAEGLESREVVARSHVSAATIWRLRKEGRL